MSEQIEYRSFGPAMSGQIDYLSFSPDHIAPLLLDLTRAGSFEPIQRPAQANSIGPIGLLVLAHFDTPIFVPVGPICCQLHSTTLTAETQSP